MDYCRLVLRRFLTLWMVGVVLAGCGSSGTSVSATYPLVAGTNSRLFGRAVLERSAVGATAELTDLNGDSLGYPRAKVDSSGNFRIPIDPTGLPKEFRVRVNPSTDSKWNFPIIANIENYGPATRVYPNLLTTAAALYRERSGGTQEQADSWVRAKFDIPGSVHLGWGVDESTRSHFRHSLFLAQASGDPSAYLTSLLNDGDSRAQAASAAEEEKGITDFFSDTGTSIIANIGADSILFVGGKITGAITQALGLNIGDPVSAQTVAGQLTEIEDSLEELGAQLNADFGKLAELTEASALLNTYLTLTSSLQPLLTEYKVQNQNLVTLANEADMNNTPFVPSQALQDLQAGISSFDGQTSLNEMSAALLGNNESASLLRTYLQLLSSLGGTPPENPASPTAAAWADSPFLSNTRTLDPYIPFVEFYAEQQLLALNLLAENANFSLEQSTVEDARKSAADAQYSILEQSQYIRFPQATDLVFCDPGAAFRARTKSPSPKTPSGTLFYAQVQGLTEAYGDYETYPDLQNNVKVFTDGGTAFLQDLDKFSVPGYPDGWRLPSLDEVQQLRQFALQASPNDAIDGLEKLGFTNVSSLGNSGGEVWYLDTDDQNVDGIAVEDGPGIEDYDNYIDENDPVKVFDFATGETYGYDAQTTYDHLFYESHCYFMVNYQSFDSSLGYEQIVAAGFRPTTAPTVELSEDGTQVSATLNGQDVTQYCAWKSSNPNQLEVRSFGDDLGKLYWHPGEGALTSQTITASLLGMDSSTGERKTLQSSLTVQVPDPIPSRTLTGIILTPSNSFLLNSSENTVFTATGLYDDQTLQNISSQVTWSLELPDGSPYPPGKATINGSVPGILVFTGPILGDSLVVIKATLGATVGKTQLQVATPF